MDKQECKHDGFTLIELLVSISIIGILATGSVATFGGYQERAQLAKEQVECGQVNRCNAAKEICLDGGKTAAECNLLCDVSGIICNTDVIIGSQAWNRKNINAGAFAPTSVAGMPDDGSIKWCLNNDITNCNIHGGLYTWEAAQNVCQDGYRLPNIIESQALVAFVSTCADLAEGGSTNFNATGGGFLAARIGSFNTGYSLFWTSEGLANVFGRTFRIDVGDTYCTGQSALSFSNIPAASVRCIKDE